MGSEAEIKDDLARLLNGDRLSSDDSRALFERMLRGEMDEAQIASALSLMQARGVTLDELVGAARVMRSHVITVQTPDDGVPVIDTCGTGGAPKTFNVSTAAAILAAAAAPGKIRVAKHGNRSRTGRGSAEVLTALGVNVDAPPEVQSRCLAEIGVCFCFAIHHHPAAKHAAGVRKSLAFPTIFNLLGPLTNPAGAPRQLMGIYSRDLQELMGKALAALGSERAMVVHSDDGLDEIAISAPTRIAHVREGSVSFETIDPRDLGLSLAPLDAVRATSVEESAQMIRSVFAGEAGAPRDFTAINAAGALVVAGVSENFEQGLGMVSDALDTNRASETLSRLAEVSHSG